MRSVRIAVRVSPWPVLARDRELALQLLVVGPQLVVGNRPVDADAVLAVDAEIGRVKARCVARVVHHGTADAAAAVVRAHHHGILTTDDAGLGPVEVPRPGLIADPVLVGIPEWACFQDHDPPAGTRQALCQDGAARPGPDDHQVNWFGGAEPAHAVAARQRPPAPPKRSSTLILVGIAAVVKPLRSLARSGIGH